MSNTDLDIDDLIRHDAETWRNGFTPPALDDLLPATPDVRAHPASRRIRRRLAPLAVAAAVAAGAVAIAVWPDRDAPDGRTPAAGPSVVSSSVPGGSSGVSTIHHQVSQTSDFTGGVRVQITLRADVVGSLSFGSDDAPVVNYLPDAAQPLAAVDQTSTVSLAPGTYTVVYKPVADRYLRGPASKRAFVPFPIGAAAAAEGAHPCTPATITVTEGGTTSFDLTC